MGRELIYLGGKQIKALLSPVRRYTIAYINILSWAIQVSKGLVHLHLHKGPLSTLWPPLPSLLSSHWVPAVLSFTSLSSSHHLPLHLSITRQCLFLRMYDISPPALSSTWPPSLSLSLLSAHFPHLLQLSLVFSVKTNLCWSDVSIPLDTDVSLVDRECRVYREKQDSADTVESVTVIYGLEFGAAL